MEDVDEESLMVSFLNEMLFYVEKDLIADEVELAISDHKLEAKVGMHPKISQQTDIKAATFNNLKIIRTDQGLRTRIVFDA
jgi:SHS2 domain-containing protein